MKPHTKKINTKHTNQVRIIGGTHRGRKIPFISAEGLRPTPDIVRERLFNWLGQDLTGQNVLDLFAGSGVLGFEALSRHANQVWQCEIRRSTAQNLRKIAQEFGFSGSLNVQNQDGIQFLRSTNQQFHTVFLDPPFTWQNWHELWNVLLPRLHLNASVYAEASHLPAFPEILHIHRQGKTGQSQFVLLRHIQPTD